MFKHVTARVGLRGVVLAAALLGAAMVVAPAPAYAATGNVTCANAEIDQTVITGNVTVPAGAICFLFGDTVQGNVSVGPGAVFVAGSTWMQRNLSTEGALGLEMIEDEVDGNSSFDATTGGFGICSPEITACAILVFSVNPGIPNPHPHGPGNKFGNVSITNTSPVGVDYAGNFVAGNLTCSGNTWVSNAGFPNTVLGQELGQCAGL